VKNAKKKAEFKVFSFFIIKKLTSIKIFKAKAIKKFFLYDPPPILTIVLKRFLQKSVGRFEKNGASIRIPLKLNLDKFTLLKAKKTVEEEEIHSSQMHIYELYAIVVHSGSISGGHYVAYAKFGENWFVFNDSDFRVTRVENVLNTEPYILFYRKADLKN